MRKTPVKLRSIAVVDENWGIGREGDLLAHLPGDLEFFKKKTLGNIVIMGRKTLDSLPGKRPLPGRITIVMTSNAMLKDELEISDDFYTASSEVGLFEVLEVLLSENPDIIPYVAGGESIYTMLLPYTDTCFITKIEKSFVADVHFPNLDDNPEFDLIDESPFVTENGMTYKFCEYFRRG